MLGTLDAVAWTLNIRGGDVDHTPVALAYALVHADATAELFVAPDKVTDAVRRHLGNAVTLRDRTAFADALNALDGKTVALDPDAAVAGIAQALSDGGATLLERRDPTALPKARKTPAEAQGHRDAQARDGVAVAKFLHWLDTEAPKGGQTELSAAAQLLVFRQENDGLVDLSFPTISAAGAHAALPHYRVDEDSDAPLDPGSVYLCDSGGQYRDGTTDITRTVWIAGEGEAAAPPKEVRDRFTRVSEGSHRARHADLSRWHQRRPDRRLRARAALVKRGSITRMAPATASARSSAFTKARNASPSRPAGRRGRASRCDRA